MDHPRSSHRPHGNQRGLSLIDGLIALAILAFGMLAMTRLQARAVAQGTESATRLIAAQFADELLSSAIVDNTNYGCYTVPAAGACASEGAAARTLAWKERVAATLPGGNATSTYIAATERLQVVVSWTGKEAGEARRVEVTTDVR